MALAVRIEIGGVMIADRLAPSMIRGSVTPAGRNQTRLHHLGTQGSSGLIRHTLPLPSTKNQTCIESTPIA